MKKQFYIFITILFLGNSLSCFSMSLVNRMGNFLVKNNHLIGLSALCAPDALKIIKCNNEEYSNAKLLAGADTEQFVKQTLREYKFPEKMINKLKINGWGNFCAGSNHINVPINDFLLAKAQALYSGKKIKKDELRDPFYNTLMTESEIKEVANILKVEKHIIETCSDSIYPISNLTPETLKAWKTSIIHEGAHIYYNHSDQRIVYLSTIPFLIECAAKYLKVNQLPKQGKFLNLYYSLSLFGYKYGIANIGYLLLAKFHENQADKEIVKRCKDPEILKVKAKKFDAFAKIDRKNYLEQVIDAHKPNHIRAEYFRKAAEALEQEKKS